MSSALTGLRVLVGISDPWEFVSDNGESRSGTIVSEIDGSGESSPVLRIRLDRKVAASGMSAETVVAAFRHAGATRQDLLSGRLVPCNFAAGIDKHDLFAGPLAFIGGLQLVP